MKTGTVFHKPAESVELVHRLYSPAPDHYALAVGVLVPFTLHDAQGGHTRPDTPLWDVINAALGDQVFDEGWPKPTGEFLVAGSCHPPAGHTQQPVSVRVAVGPIEKQLAVFGNRHVTLNGTISSPEPFTCIDICLENAFGGPDHAANPSGKGAVPEKKGGSSFTQTNGETATQRPLPNIELPNALTLRATDTPPVASLGPLPAGYPQRTRYLGDFGQTWQKERWPHLPLDTEPRYFMAGAPDQSHTTHWSAGEQVRILNMHPDYPELLATLPDMRVRIIVQDTHADGTPRYREPEVAADTVWLLPGQCLGILVLRGQLSVKNPDGSDIQAVTAGLEASNSEPLPIEHYAEMLAAVVQAAPQPAPFAPTQAVPAETGTAADPERAALHRQHVLDRMARGLSCTGMDLEHANLAGLTLHNIDFSGALLAGANFSGTQLHHVIFNDIFMPGVSFDGATLHACQFINTSLHQASFSGAVLEHCQLDNADCAEMHLEDARLEGCSLPGSTFNSAWMQGLQMLRCNASNAQFNSAHLAQATLKESCLDNANLTGARLVSSLFKDTSLLNANFSFCDATRAVLDGCNLQGSQASQGSSFCSASLKNATLNQVSWMGASLDEACLDGIQADQADFSSSTLTGTQLNRASLQGACFDHADLTKARLSFSNMMQASFIGTCLTDAQLSHSNLYAATFVDNILSGLQLQGAALEKTSLATRFSL